MITINSKPIMWNDTYKKGLRYVYQLYEGRKFKTTEVLVEEFGLTVLRINGLKKAIPKAWKQYFEEYDRQQYLPIPPHNYDVCITSKIGSSKIYQYISDDISLIHSKYVKWNQDLGEEICQSIWEYGNLHMDIYRVTNIPKYRSFQYRFLQRAIVTNIQLKAWKITDSDLCCFCGEQVESLIHLFVQCRYVEQLWEEVERYIKERWGISQLHMSPKQIVLNRIYPKRNHVINMICLLTKQFIYRRMKNV